MSYTAALRALCDDLAELHEDARALAAAERPAAIVARDAVLAAVADPYRDVAGVSVTAVQAVTLDAVAQHPVAALRAMLARAPTAFPELRPTAPATSAAQAWGRAGLHASLMQRAWTYSDPASWPTGAARWTALADLAAVVEAVALLDRDLVPDPNHAAALSPGLRIAAREVRLLASAEHLPALSEPRLLPTKPVRVTNLRDVAGAQVRLASLLKSAQHVDPGALRNVTHAHRHTVAVLGWALRQLASSDQRLGPLARRVNDHAQALDLRRDRGVASISPGDPRPLAQAREIEGVAVALHQRGSITLDAQPAILAAVRSSIHVTEAIADVADKQLAAGKWVVPDAKSVELRWAPFQRSEEPPRTVTVLSRAREHGRALDILGLLPKPSPRPVTVTLAASQLSAGLSTSIHRPQDPATRPAIGPAI